MNTNSGIEDLNAIELTVNGIKRVARISDRDILADVIREQFRLTGTHLGCDQGVCGACTVLIDGIPQRSCIALARDCENVKITTIEGFDGDPIMKEMRDAFSEKHALQCGFCTPGMLIVARDIVLRLGETDESRIRHELAGNLCRCTGYMGIVDAVSEVSQGKVATGSAAPSIISNQETESLTLTKADRIDEEGTRTIYSKKSEDFPSSISQSIKVDLPASEAWIVMRDLRTAANCIPGAEVVSLTEQEVTGKMHMALGPIRAQFTGNGIYEINDETREGSMTAGGRDALTGSTVKAGITWTVKEDGSSGSVIDISLGWKLTGALAQFGRSGIVIETVKRLATMFGENLERLLREGTVGESKSAPVGIRTLIWPVIKSWFSGLFKRKRKNDE